jgi:signal transduction histidine kinase/ligand-binding sensor domain-containing protein
MNWFHIQGHVVRACALALLLAPQGPAQNLGRLPMKIYGVEQGMSSEVVVALEQTRDGILWAATDAGLQQFDGQTFVPARISLPFPVLQDLFADTDGSLWVASFGGLVRIDRGRATVFGNGSGIPPGSVERVARDGAGRLWIMTGGRLWVETAAMGFAPGPALPVPDVVTQMFANAGSDAIWAMAGQRLWSLGSGASQWREDPLPAMAPGEAVNGFAVDGSGQQWLRTSMRLWKKPVQEAWSLARTNVLGGFSLYSRMDRDRLGWVWFEDAEGLWRAKGKEEEWYAPKAMEGRGGLVDQDGGVWLRTHRGVARILGRNRWRTFGTEEGLSSPTIWQTLRDPQGRMWAGTDLGLDVYEGHRWRSVLQTRTLWLTLGRSGDLWAGGSPGGTVHRIDLRTLRHQTLRVEPLPLSRIVGGLAVDQDGCPWVGDRQAGLVRGQLSGSRWKWTPMQINGRVPQQVTYLLAGPDGQMFVSHREGVSVFRQGQWTDVPGVLDQAPMALALGPNLDLAVAYSNSPKITVHLLRDGHYQDTLALDPFRKEPQIGIYALGWEPSGFLWMGTSTGAARILPGREGSLQRFSSMDGLACNDCDQFSLTVEPGHVWIGTSRGLASYQGDVPGTAPALRAPVLLSMKAGKGSMEFDPWPPKIPAGIRNLELSFLVPNYQNPGSLTFQAYLEGVDPQWIDLDQGRVRYPGLRPGHYVLRLRGILDQTTPGAVLEVPFQVLPRWWESMPALIAYGLAGILALLSLGYLRQKTLLARNRFLQKEVDRQTRGVQQASQAKSDFLANMSHELRTPLNAILLYGELLLENAVEAGDASATHDLERIRDSARHLLSLINGILDLSKIEAGKMTLFLEDVALGQLLEDVASVLTPMAQDKGNQLEMIQDPSLNLLHTDMTKLRQILLNLVNNACKFTENGKITLETSLEGEQIRFQIRDTGIGMTPEQCDRLFEPFVQADSSTTKKFGGTGLGLTISKRLCELLGGRIAVESQPGTGTVFTVFLPILAQESLPGRQ